MNRTLLPCLILVAASALWSSPLHASPCPGASGPLVDMKLGLHVLAYAGSSLCGTSAPQGFGCDAVNDQSQLETSWPSDQRARVYVIALDICPSTGLKSATFGIDFFAYNYETYSGLVINAFNPCGSIVVPSQNPNPAFPQEPGSGVTVGFNTCQQAVDPTDPQEEAYAILGWFDATCYDAATSLQITPRLYLPAPDLTAMSCDDEVSELCYPTWTGSVRFGGGAGYSPCLDPAECFPNGCPPPPPGPLTCHDSAIPVKQATWSSIKSRAN